MRPSAPCIPRTFPHNRTAGNECGPPGTSGGDTRRVANRPLALGLRCRTASLQECRNRTRWSYEGPVFVPGHRRAWANVHRSRARAGISRIATCPEIRYTRRVAVSFRIPVIEPSGGSQLGQVIPVDGSGTRPKEAGWHGARPICEVIDRGHRAAPDAEALRYLVALRGQEHNLTGAAPSTGWPASTLLLSFTFNRQDVGRTGRTPW